MRKSSFAAVLSVMFVLGLAGPAVAEEASLQGTSSSPESLFDSFLNNEIPAFYPESEESFYFADISERDWGYTGDAEDRVDLDNDGEAEQILEGEYGGMYLDVRDGQVVVLAKGDGTCAALTYGYYDGKAWICHCDTTHQGRDWFHLDQYDGSGNIVDSFDLNANFFEGDLQDQYDANDEYTFRDQNISMEQFVSLVKEIFGETFPGMPDISASADGAEAGDDILYYGTLTPEPMLAGWPYVTGISINPENRTVTLTGELAAVSCPVPAGFDFYADPHLMGSDSVEFTYDENTMAGASSGEDGTSLLSVEEFVQYMQECLGNGLGFEMEVRDGVIVELLLLS